MANREDVAEGRRAAAVASLELSRSFSLPLPTLTKPLMDPERDDRWKRLRVALVGGSFCLPAAVEEEVEGEAAAPLALGLRSGYRSKYDGRAEAVPAVSLIAWLLYVNARSLASMNPSRREARLTKQIARCSCISRSGRAEGANGVLCSTMRPCELRIGTHAALELTLSSEARRERERAGDERARF